MKTDPDCTFPSITLLLQTIIQKSGGQLFDQMAKQMKVVSQKRIKTVIKITVIADI